MKPATSAYPSLHTDTLSSDPWNFLAGFAISTVHNEPVDRAVSFLTQE